MRDERITEQSNRVYKKCFYIMSIAFLIDFLFKFNFFGLFFELTDEVMLFMWLEAIMLVAVFYVAFFSLAKKGIALGIEESENGISPLKKQMKVTLIMNVIINVGLWVPRWISYDWSTSELLGWSAVGFVSAIHLVTFALAFIVVFASLRISYKIAKKALEKELAE